MLAVKFWPHWNQQRAAKLHSNSCVSAMSFNLPPRLSSMPINWWLSDQAEFGIPCIVDLGSSQEAKLFNHLNNKNGNLLCASGNSRVNTLLKHNFEKIIERNWLTLFCDWKTMLVVLYSLNSNLSEQCIEIASMISVRTVLGKTTHHTRMWETSENVI